MATIEGARCQRPRGEDRFAHARQGRRPHHVAYRSEQCHAAQQRLRRHRHRYGYEQCRHGDGGGPNPQAAWPADRRRYRGASQAPRSITRLSGRQARLAAVGDRYQPAWALKPGGHDSSPGPAGQYAVTEPYQGYFSIHSEHFATGLLPHGIIGTEEVEFFGDPSIIRWL